MHCSGRWVDPRAGLEGAQNRKSVVPAAARPINFPCRAESLTECANPAALSSPVIQVPTALCNELRPT